MDLEGLARVQSVLMKVHLDRAGAMPEEVVRFYVAEIAMVVDYLHRKKIVHRWAASY